MAEKFYITTPIYYPSDKLHIGHAYSTTITDSLARFKRKEGYDVFFLTGSDEHGQKIERIAQSKGMEPKAYVDEIIKSIQELWSLMNISYDDFIRTTDSRHEKAVQEIFMRLYQKGDIYKDVYEGAYCAPCESFWTERQLVDGKCPDCGRDVEQVKEESYYFRLSKYQDRLIEYINTHPNFIQPESRKNEMMQNFLLPGLEDISVSRTSFKWGIPVPFDPDHVIYVWIDALSNYITALGYGSNDERLFEKYWPANVHIMAKEIVRFHSIIWPAILMALDEELPETIYAHGWLLLEGGKMSKSKGNVVDPVILCDRYGVDAIRYFLLRHMGFDQDATFSNEALLTHINTDLANDLGNLLSRTVAMIEKYFDKAVPPMDTLQPEDIQLQQQCMDMVHNVKADMDALHVADALSQIWKYISFCNKYIDKTEPWVLGKTEEGKPRLGTVLYTLAESLRIIAVLLEAFMPNTSPRIYEQLGIAQDDALHQWSSIQTFGALPVGTKVCKGEALFPRIDIEAELENLEALSAPDSNDKPKESPAEETDPIIEKPEISIEDFDKLDLRTGKILSCVPVEKADRLLQFQIKMGDEERTILSGIRKWYDKPEELLGKTVVVIANLKPRKIRGIMSHGMLLSAIDESVDSLSLLTSLNDIADGSEIS